jgi:hypothetical protein
MTKSLAQLVRSQNRLCCHALRLPTSAEPCAAPSATASSAMQNMQMSVRQHANATMLAEFEQTLRSMSASRVAQGGAPRTWNTLVNRLQGLQLTLRKTKEGRVGITRLVSDEDEVVSTWAATYALFWDEREARAGLEARASTEGLVASESKIVLREFDAGRLDTSWNPPRRTSRSAAQTRPLPREEHC